MVFVAVLMLAAILDSTRANTATVLSSHSATGTADWALGLLDQLRVVDAGAPAELPYDRNDYDSWRDTDGDCQNARHEVLVASSVVAVEFTGSDRCKVAAGLWIDAYTGDEIRKADQASIDHVVSLAEAHHAGAWVWPVEWKRAHFNDIEDPATLAVTAAAVNQAKGSSTTWIPIDADARCRYLVARVRVRTRWALTIGPDEHKAATEELASCATAGLPTNPETAPLDLVGFGTDPPIETRPTPTITPGVCDPGYESVCIPMSDRDLNCDDIEHRRFSVGANDRHRFDGDSNGVGCERDA